MSGPETPHRFRVSLLEAMGLPDVTSERPGTTVTASPDRQGSGFFAAYTVGLHRVLWCDPAIVEAVGPLRNGNRALGDDELRTAAAERSWPELGRSVMKTLVGPVGPTVGPADGFEARPLDWSRAADLDRMREFVDACDEDDLDAAEVELDALDDLAVGVFDQDGRIAAYASMRGFDLFDGWGDIGVVADPDRRHRGLGRSAVSTLIDERCPSGWEPLYRCEPTNAGSDRLSAGLGFEVAISLVAFSVVA